MLKKLIQFFTLEKGESKSVIEAVQKRDSLLILLKLISNGVDINQKDMYGYTALHYAIEEGDFELVKFLLDHNANPNIQDANGVTPYNLARSYAGLEPIVELLLQKGADPKIKDKFGKTYLM